MKKRVKTTAVTSFVLLNQNHLHLLVLLVCLHTSGVNCIRVHDHNGADATTEVSESATMQTAATTMESVTDSTTTEIPSTSTVTSTTVGTEKTPKLPEGVQDKTLNATVHKMKEKPEDSEGSPASIANVGHVRLHHSYEVSEEHNEDGPPLMTTSKSPIRIDSVKQLHTSQLNTPNEKAQFIPSPEITHFNNVDNFYPTTGRLPAQLNATSTQLQSNPTLPTNASHLHNQRVHSAIHKHPFSLGGKQSVPFNGSNHKKSIVNGNHFGSQKHHRNNKSMEHTVRRGKPRPIPSNDIHATGSVMFPEQQHAFDTNFPVHASLSYESQEKNPGLQYLESDDLGQQPQNYDGFSNHPKTQAIPDELYKHQIADAIDVPDINPDDRAKIVHDNKVQKGSVHHFAVTSNDHPYEFENNDAYQFNTHQNYEFAKDHVIPILSTEKPYQQEFVTSEDWTSNHHHHPEYQQHSLSNLEHHQHKYVQHYGSQPDHKNTWKKIIQVLSAIIPIGLAISALNPRVIYVSPNSTTDFPASPIPISLTSNTMRQRQSGANYKHEEFSLGPPEAFKVIHFDSNDRICVTKRYCDLLRAGNDLDSSFLKDNLRRAAMAEFAKDYKKLDGLNELLKALESEQHCFKLVCDEK